LRSSLSHVILRQSEYIRRGFLLSRGAFKLLCYLRRLTLLDFHSQFLRSTMSVSITIESPRLPVPVFSKPKTPPEYTFRHGPGSPLETYDSPARSAMVGSSAGEIRSLELQSLPNPQHSESLSSGTADQMQTIWEPFKNRFRVLAACLTAFANGMNDSANGALIESMER
jgi:phosphate/sulfate permease